MVTATLFVVGLVLLLAGAEVLVRGASRLAAAFAISPLVIGLTVVAYSTGAPELAVSVRSSLAGQPDLALGNVVGSCICNILLILGLSALISPLRVAQKLVRIDVPLMIVASTLVLALGFDGRLSRADGGLLFLGGIAYTAFAVWESRRESRLVQEEYAAEYGAPPDTARTGWPRHALFIGIGLGLLVLGAQWLVDGAVAVARVLGIGELIIGLTVVSVGTSLPEIATSVIASLRGERDIAVGNVVGSNLFNVLSVLGLAAFVAPAGVAVSGAALRFDIPVMIAASIACLPILFSGYAVPRWQGALLLGYYIAYTAYLVMNTTHHGALPWFSLTMLVIVIPLTVAGLVAVTIQSLRHERGDRAAMGQVDRLETPLEPVSEATGPADGPPAAAPGP
jgi:cation:H+ antiporter